MRKRIRRHIRLELNFKNNIIKKKNDLIFNVKKGKEIMIVDIVRIIN